MKKLTSVFLAGVLVASGCACALSVSADDSQKATIKVVDSSAPSEVTTYEAYVGDKIECVITGYSQEAVTSVLTDLYIALQDLFNRMTGHSQRKLFLNYHRYLSAISPMVTLQKHLNIKKGVKDGLSVSMSKNTKQNMR